MWIDIREPLTGKLLFKYDPICDRIEIQRRGQTTHISLGIYKRKHDMNEELQVIITNLVPPLQEKVTQRINEILKKYPNTAFAINDITEDRAILGKGPACELRWQSYGHDSTFDENIKHQVRQIVRPVELETIYI